MDNIWKSYSDAERQVNFLKTQVGDIDESLRQRWDDLSAELSRNELNELKERRAAFGQKVAQHDSTKKSLDGKKAELECCEKDLLELNEQKPLAEQQLQVSFSDDS
ncbi:unnamed protein product [Gongylonema pulchrum]|uniref:Uncharacterized protein n=1 Tax=Gongylonema pulchrum TaxID=637853 RepID=A0A183EYG6_9BILA|nr:unnamed protein product [Gongylonema pulchrum]